MIVPRSPCHNMKFVQINGHNYKTDGTFIYSVCGTALVFHMSQNFPGPMTAVEKSIQNLFVMF